MTISNAGGPPPIHSQNGNYTLRLVDAQSVVQMMAGGTLTIPQLAWPMNTVIEVNTFGGALTLVLGANVVLEPVGRITLPQFGTGGLRFQLSNAGSDFWAVSGAFA